MKTATQKTLPQLLNRALLATLVLFLYTPLTSARLLLKGMLLDTTFAQSDSIVAQILENGETFPLTYGQPFEFALPPDNSWNICIRDAQREQCYEITLPSPGDSLVSDSLQNNNRIELFTSFLNDGTAQSSTQNVAIDSVVADSAAEPEVQEIELLTRLRPVVIQVRKRPQRSLGQSTVASKAIARQPGLAEADVIKAIQALPGVVASSDFSSKIYVRGGSADQNLFLFDDAVVYSPVHFFGLFSTFIVEGIDQVNFYKGGFSPSYGNRLSSVVDVKSRKGGRENNDTLKLGGSAQLSTFATTLAFEASKNQTRFNLGGRSTYIKEVLGLLNRTGVTDINIDYRFFDIQGNLFQGFGENMGVQLSLYTGRDNLTFSPLETFWGNTALPLNFFWQLNDQLRFDATLSFSRFDQEFGIENIQTFTNEISSLGARATLKYDGLDNHSLRGGVELQFFETLFGNRSDFINLTIESTTRFALLSLYLEDAYQRGRWNISPGLRSNYLSTLKQFTAEPRLSLRYALSERSRIDAHCGYYKQFINSVDFGDFESINEFYYPAKRERTQTIPEATGILFSAGYSIDDVLDNFDIIAEGYYKTLDDLIAFAPDERPDSIANDPQVALGDLFIRAEGYSLGAEVGLRRNEGKIVGGISYAYGYSVQKEGELAFRARWDLTHSLKLDGGVNWRDAQGTALWSSRKNFLRSSFQLRYSTGVPYSQIIGYLPTHFILQGEGQLTGGPTPSFNGNLATPLGGRNTSRYPPYFRFDIKVVDWGRENRWEFNWTLLNILNTENVFLYTYDNSIQPPRRSTIAQFPFFPILLSYKRYF